MKKLLVKLYWFVRQHYICRHDFDVCTIEGDDSPRLVCNNCGLDLGYIDY